MLCSKFPKRIKARVCVDYAEVHAIEIFDISPLKILTDQKLWTFVEDPVNFCLTLDDVSHPLNVWELCFQQLIFLFQVVLSALFFDQISFSLILLFVLLSDGVDKLNVKLCFQFDSEPGINIVGKYSDNAMKC